MRADERRRGLARHLGARLRRRSASAASTTRRSGSRASAHSPASSFDDHMPSSRRRRVRHAFRTRSSAAASCDRNQSSDCAHGRLELAAGVVSGTHVRGRRPDERLAAPARDRQVEHEPERRLRGRVEPGVERLVGARVDVELERGHPATRVQDELELARRTGQRLVAAGGRPPPPSQSAESGLRPPPPRRRRCAPARSRRARASRSGTRRRARRRARQRSRATELADVRARAASSLTPPAGACP